MGRTGALKKIVSNIRISQNVLPSSIDTSSIDTWMAIINPLVSGKSSPDFSSAFDAMLSTSVVSR
jgi:hypothetical protein